MEKNKGGIKLLLIGGSAGSLDVLMQVMPALPLLETIAIVIVLHRKSSDDSMLEALLTAKSKTPVRETEDKAPIQPGSVYVAPADYHLLFETDGRLSLDDSEKVNYSRPSIDVSFESAAAAYGNKTTAILLSGANNDGTNGLTAIQGAGGITAVQKPESAEMAFMPAHAISHTTPDYLLDPAEMVDFIVNLDQLS